MSILFVDHRSEFDGVITHFKEELASLRTGRATAAMVENIPVEAYGATMNIKSLGNISVPDAKTLIVEPWDKSLLKEVEKALAEARVGANPVIDGGIIRLSFSVMTEETRKQVVKLMHQKLEDARIAVRQLRETLREEVSRKEQAKEIAEDERFRAQDELDRLAKDYNEKLMELAEEKEAEIMKV